MDPLNAIGGIGGTSGIVLGCAFLVYKFCKGRRLHTKSGCIDIQLSAEVEQETERKQDPESKEDD